MSISTARKVVLGLWVAMAGLWLMTILLAMDRPSEVVFALLLAVPSTIYGVIGGLVARRRPENPIGWLFATVGLSLALWLFGMSFAQAGLDGRPGLGALPGAALAGWLGVLVPFALPVAMPIFLLYFPDGRLRSSRWRPAMLAALVGGALMLLGGIGTIRNFSGTIPLRTPNLVARIPSIGGFWAVGLALVVAASFAGLVAMVLRFRSAPPEERQSLRLLVAMIVAMAIASAVAIAAWPAAGSAEWLWIFAVLAFLVDGFGLLIGIPLATAAAVLTYGLYDVGVVVKWSSRRRSSTCCSSCSSY
ncbi:MAG: hypothetical protein L0206_09155 [Actinobacteria bacterium]|nr:hypothetical protein [Actinomycetota bacterium]